MEEYRSFNALPERTPEEIDRKTKAYKKFIDGKGMSFLKAMADAHVAQFFVNKAEAIKEFIMTDGEFRQILSGYNEGWQNRKVAKASVLSLENRFFHWFLEFPVVFYEGGFDCIIGNPPFLGGQKLSGSFGDRYLEYIKYQYAPIGAVDLVTYFFRRNFCLIKQTGFLSLIATKTISQGRAREEGLDIIIKSGGVINHAIRSIRWPGTAAVEVSLITITKQSWGKKFFLSSKEVKNISAYLDEEVNTDPPYQLKQNEGKSYQGSIVLGKGFVLQDYEVKSLIAKNQKNKEVLFPYLNGDDLNNNPDQSPSRWVINFFNWTEEKAKQYSDCYEILFNNVKAVRQLDNRKSYRDNWWQYAEKRESLYSAIRHFEHILIIPETTKHLTFDFVPSTYVYSHANKIIVTSSFAEFSCLKSNLHLYWVWKNASTLGSTMKYITTDAYETFPFPDNYKFTDRLESIGKAYHYERRQLMLKMQLGLTKTYNLFHANRIQNINHHDPILTEMDKNTFEKKYGKEIWNLWNHILKTPGTCSFGEALDGILKLRQLHVEIDKAVLNAYGWSDIQLRHDFYEVDYLPENDRVRFTIHPDARKEILKRLLELNHKIHEEEVKAGLWEKKTAKEYKIKKSKSNTAEEASSTLFE